jgi:uncharacterized DUF497 family protein
VITWNEAKRLANFRDHQVDFAGLGKFFDGELLTREDTRSAYGETRFQSIGAVNSVVLFVVWTPRGACDDAVHVISARKAGKHEAQAWYRRYGQGS